MATVHRLPTATIEHDSEASLVARIVKLAKLVLELGIAETRDILVSAAIAVAVAVPAFVLLLASLVVLIAAAFAPVFGAQWQHLLIAGGGAALLAAISIMWSVHRLTRLSWPKETVTSFQENRRWLGAQLRSRLRLR